MINKYLLKDEQLKKHRAGSKVKHCKYCSSCLLCSFEIPESQKKCTADDKTLEIWQNYTKLDITP